MQWRASRERLPHRRWSIINFVMKTRIPPRHAFVFTLALLITSLPAPAQKKQPKLEKPMAGPRATALRITPLYVAPDPTSQKVDRVQIGPRTGGCREKRPLDSRLRQHRHPVGKPEGHAIFGHDETPPPISGWMQSKGVVVENTPNGDQILMGEAANQESLASDPRGPANAARSARLLYRRLVEMFPASPLAAEAAWRAADDLWQIQKADASNRPSAHEKEAYLRDQMDEDELHKVLKYYPNTKWAAFAAFELIDNKLCGDWQGSPKCPEKEAEYYEKIRPLNSLTAPAPRRRFIWPHTAWPCCMTCSPPTAATKKPTQPSATPKNWPRT